MTHPVRKDIGLVAFKSDGGGLLYLSKHSFTSLYRANVWTSLDPGDAMVFPSVEAWEAFLGKLELADPRLHARTLADGYQLAPARLTVDVGALVVREGEWSPRRVAEAVAAVDDDTE